MCKRGEITTILLLLSAGVVLLGTALGIKDATTPQPNPLKSSAQQSSCTFKSTVTIKDENGNVLPITTNNNDVTIHYKFTTSDGKSFEGDNQLTNGVIIQNTTLADNMVGAKVDLSLKYNNQDYEVKGAFCNENPTETDRRSSTAVCNEWFGDKNQNGVQQTLRCGKTIDWGFIVKPLKPIVTPTPCPFQSKAVLKDANGQVVPVTSVNNDIALHYKFTTKDGKTFENDQGFVNGIHEENNGLSAESIGSKVALSLKYSKQDYEVTAAFCNETPAESDRHSATAACNEWYGDNTQNAVMQTLQCGKKVEWGFYIKSLKPTPTPTAVPPTRVRLKLQENNGHGGYYQCYSEHDSNTNRHENGGLTSHGNIKCRGEYTQSTDTLRIEYKIPRDSEFDPGGLRLTLNIYRCPNYTGDSGCSTKAFPEWALTHEDFALSRGSMMQCYWKHPYTSNDKNDITCYKDNITVAYPTPPPANIAQGTIDSLKLDYGTNSYYANRNIAGCQLAAPSLVSTCPSGLHCEVLKDANGVPTGVKVTGSKKTQFASAAWFAGCACNADQAMPGRGVCDPVMYRNIPAQAEQQMHNGFCFAPNNNDSAMTCMFGEKKCSFHSGSMEPGTCRTTASAPTTPPGGGNNPGQNSCPGKQEQATPNACNPACCTPGMDNQCPSGQSCNISNGYCLGGYSCGPSSDNVCNAVGQACGPVQYKESCGNGGTRWCHKYQSTCSGVGDASMCKWDVPPGNKPSCCDVCSDGSRDNNTCSDQGGTNPGTPPNGSPQTGQPATINTKVKVSNINNLDTSATHRITITYSDTADSSRKAYITKESYLLNDYSYDISIDSSYASTVPILTGHTYTIQADVTLTNGTVITSPTITSTLSASSTTVSDLTLYVSSTTSNLAQVEISAKADIKAYPPQTIYIRYYDPITNLGGEYNYDYSKSKSSYVATVTVPVGVTIRTFAAASGSTGTYGAYSIISCPGQPFKASVGHGTQCEFVVNADANKNKSSFIVSVDQYQNPPGAAPTLTPTPTTTSNQPLACNNTSPAPNSSLQLTANSSYKYPVTFKWPSQPGTTQYILHISTFCTGGLPQTADATYTVNGTEYTDEMNGCALNTWPRKVIWSVQSNNGGTVCAEQNQFSFSGNYPTPYLSATPIPPSAVCRDTECRWPQTDRCYPLNQTIAVCDKKTAQCPSGIFNATFYRLPLSDMCARSNGACLPEGTPCTQLPTSSSQMRAAVISDIDNNGTVGASDFVAAIRMFGQTVKVNGEEVKVNAQYISTLLGNLGKKVK